MSIDKPDAWESAEMATDHQTECRGEALDAYLHAPPEPRLRLEALRQLLAAYGICIGPNSLPPLNDLARELVSMAGAKDPLVRVRNPQHDPDAISDDLSGYEPEYIYMSEAEYRRTQTE